MKKLAIYAVVLVLSFVSGVHGYNEFFHPLKSVAESISVGEDCVTASKKVKEYLGKGGFIFQPSYVVYPNIYRDIETYGSSSEAAGHFINQGPIIVGVTLAFRCDAKNNLVDQVVYN